MYALVDCNNFYCSCERVFHPHLEARPVIVLSNNDGCAISRSEEAKKLGIAMAAPAFMMKKLLEQHNVAVFSSNYTLYGDMSDRVMGTLASFVPTIERYSIDEAFLNLNGLSNTDLPDLGFRIRKTIRRDTGIPVSIGIAPTKTLAKMANRHAKKHYSQAAVFWAANEVLTAEMLDATPVEGIWGIGNQHALFLARHGFKTAADLLKAPDDWVRRNLSVVGLRLLYELRGIPSIAEEPADPIRKNICTSRSFGSRISQKEPLGEALSNYAAACAFKLRQDKTCARRLEVFIQTNPHKTEERQYRRSVEVEMERPSSHTGEIIKAALRGLDLIYQPGFLYMKCGVTVIDLVSESVLQSGLFDRTDPGRNNRVMQTLDEINGSLGKDLVRSAVQGFDRNYRLKAAFLSSRYTTRMEEVLKIKN